MSEAKMVALFGGSFDPPHQGHFEMARFIHQTLRPDEIRFLFSLNRFKDQDRYAPLPDRMEMGRLLAQHYADLPLTMSDIGEQIGTHFTADILDYLSAQNPETRFIWVMGADNLVDFHNWESWRHIIEDYSIAVLDRPGFRKAALESVAGKAYANLRLDDPQALAQGEAGWCYLDNPALDISSHELRDRMITGDQNFGNPFQDVSDYIARKKLYALKPAP